MTINADSVALINTLADLACLECTDQYCPDSSFLCIWYTTDVNEFYFLSVQNIG